MTYRELIDLYKSGKLDEEQKAKVEKDIERQEAIGEYLFDEGEIPELGDCFGEDLSGEISSEQVDDEEKRFAKMIRSSIRKAFIKMGVSVSVVVLVVVLFILFALPKVVDLFYYNPGEIVGVDEGVETNRMSLDLAVYSELYLPEAYRENVRVEENGYGEYDIDIVQGTSRTNLFTNVAGEIERNRMTLYDPNLLKMLIVNAFMVDIPGVKVPYGAPDGAAGGVEDAKRALHELNDVDSYVAYVTLSDVMDYSSFVEWTEKEELAVEPEWCAIAQKTEEGFESENPMGFRYASACSSLSHDNAYPYLTYWDAVESTNAEKDWKISEEVMTTHMVSMLRYMAEQKAFNKMMKCELEYETLAKNVEDNGLHIYGFMIMGKKDEILQASNVEKVAYVYTRPMR